MTRTTVCEKDLASAMRMSLLDAQSNLEQIYQSRERLYLKVPFSEKDAAKTAGARWDPTQKSWYAPPQHSLSSFQPWLTGIARESLETIERDKIEKNRALEEWRTLPPRSTDPEEIVALVGMPFLRVVGRRCAMCDSNIYSGLVIDLGGPVMEYDHVSDQIGKMLRPSELQLLKQAFREGFDPVTSQWANKIDSQPFR